jgi:exopolysaccharide biosynthesis polyprenyl glycosylphosphotransferase
VVADRLVQYDVRLRRERTHRRLVISLIRSFARVISLHVLDGATVVGTILLMSRLWSPFYATRELIPVIVAIVLLSLNALSAYDPGDSRRDERRLLIGVGLAMLILGFLTVFPPRLALGLPSLVAMGAAVFLALMLGRKLIDQMVRQAYVHGIGLRRAIMIGNLDQVSRAIEELREERTIDQYIVGHLTPDDEPDPAAIGKVSSVEAILGDYDIQEVIVASTLPPDVIRDVVACCFEAGVKLYVIPAVIGVVDCRAEPLRVGTCPLVRLHPSRLEFPGLLLKRVFDLAIAFLLLAICAPVIALIALAVRLESSGPVFFRATRIGLGGRPFTMWKFRSMYLDAAEREKDLAHLNIYQGGTFKIKNDPRVTKVGRFLRRSSLDELPQLFNVISGNMSLVGPRPALPADIERYAPHHFERLTVIPGITGPWQVGGRNLITDFDTVVRMERAYIRSWSLLLDAKILLRTLRVVVTGEGAF